MHPTAELVNQLIVRQAKGLNAFARLVWRHSCDPEICRITIDVLAGPRAAYPSIELIGAVAGANENRAANVVTQWLHDLSLIHI